MNGSEVSTIIPPRFSILIGGLGYHTSAKTYSARTTDRDEPSNVEETLAPGKAIAPPFALNHMSIIIFCYNSCQPLGVRCVERRTDGVETSKEHPATLPT